jgi:syntaxin 1B/2/3
MMRDFLSSVSAITEGIKKMNEYAEELEKYTLLKQTSVLNVEEERGLDRKIEITNMHFLDLSRMMKESIENLQKDTKKLSNTDKDKKIIENQELYTFRLKDDMAKALRKYQNVQCSYKQREDEKLKETFLIANPKATKSDLEKLTAGQEGEAILAAAFALGSHSAQGILNQAKDRKKKIEKIIETINILVSLIGDIDKLVKKNAHVVDQITVNMVAAEEHTVEAIGQLDSALEHERRAMFWKRCIYGFLLFLILFFIGYITKGKFWGTKNS